MSAPRVLNTPDDIKNYPENQVVYRNNKTPVRVIECAWGKVGADGVVTHPAERVSFTQNKQGGWDKASALALGDVDTLPNYTAPPPVKPQLDTIVEKLAGLEAKLNTIETQTKP